MRWRIIVLQIAALLLLVGGAFGALYGSNFANGQINQQLAPQQIFFPTDMTMLQKPYQIQAYSGEQVLTGDQAHAYAEGYIALHLSEIGQGHPYSYWSGQAITDGANAKAATDPTVKQQWLTKQAADQATADTLFKGDTLRTMLNEAWTMSVFAQIAFYAGLALIAGAVIVFFSLVFETLEAVRGAEDVVVVPASKYHEPVATN
jgi:hypothetical protein